MKNTSNFFGATNMLTISSVMHETHTMPVIKHRKLHAHSLQFLNKQKGVVLFFALIALVVMSLAAVALIRSVDTNSLISGNLSFKQSTLNSADRGTEAATLWLRSQNANPTVFESNSTGNGYYALSTGDARALVDGSTARVEAAADTEGNTARYIIQRMCRVAGAPTTLNCATASVCNGCVKSAGLPLTPSQRVMYRITSAVTAPKGTVSYIQTFAY